MVVELNHATYIETWEVYNISEKWILYDILGDIWIEWFEFVKGYIYTTNILVCYK